MEEWNGHFLKGRCPTYNKELFKVYQLYAYSLIIFRKQTQVTHKQVCREHYIYYNLSVYKNKTFGYAVRRTQMKEA